jgi:hypothetical protein
MTHDGLEQREGAPMVLEGVECEQLEGGCELVLQ